ncbi:UNVERIFIED_ORG: hypothetical protein J2X74_003189 [Bacillus sp. 1751]|nr:hypothetical protein [Bacillus sp. 1751]
MHLIIIEVNKRNGRKAYIDESGETYLDCVLCEKPVNITDFGNKSNGWYGKRTECKQCRCTKEAKQRKIERKAKAMIKEYAAINSEKMLIVWKSERGDRKAYKNRDGQLFIECLFCKEVLHDTEFHYNKEHALKVSPYCRECNSLYKKMTYNPVERRESHIKHREQANKRHREWYYENREYNIKKWAEYREENHEKVKEISNRWKRKNSEYCTAYKRKQYKLYPYKALAIQQKRRALKKSLPNTLTIHQAQQVLQDGCCLTGVNEDLHLDHIIPLATGHGGTIYENMMALKGDLNRSKQARNVFEWAEDKHEEFGFTMEHFYAVMTEVAKRNDMTLNEYKEYVFWCYENPRMILD